MLWAWIVAIVVLAGNDLNSGIRRESDRFSAGEDDYHKKKIVVEDLRKHIQTRTNENEVRSIIMSRTEIAKANNPDA